MEYIESGREGGWDGRGKSAAGCFGGWDGRCLKDCGQNTRTNRKSCFLHLVKVTDDISTQGVLNVGKTDAGCATWPGYVGK